MAQLHVLEHTGNNRYQIVVHAPTPVGNNSAGFAWSTLLKNAGLAQTSLAIGTGPGQVTQAEADAIANGTVIEVAFQWDDDPAMNNAQRLAALTAYAEARVADVLAEYSAKLRWFGFTVT